MSQDKVESYYTGWHYMQVPSKNPRQATIKSHNHPMKSLVSLSPWKSMIHDQMTENSGDFC
jgi:hypothetical protein